MLITIVTVNYNDFKGLEKTINSVKSQTFKDFEYIVIDGGSNDGSERVINENEDIITKSKIESDKGIYDAMNKGINLSTGDFLIFMNSGDNFSDKNVLNNFANSIDSFDKVYFGNANIISENSSWFYPNNLISQSNIDKWLCNNLPNHQAMFFPKTFYNTNNYNLNFKIAGDSDYKFRSRNKCGFVFLDFVVCDFYIGGVSSNFSSLKRVMSIINESWTIHKKYRGSYKALKRVGNLIVKYIINLIIGDNGLSFILKKIRK